MNQYVRDPAKRNFGSRDEQLAIRESRQSVRDPFGMTVRKLLRVPHIRAHRHREDDILRRGAHTQSEAPRRSQSFDRDANTLSLMNHEEFIGKSGA
jgi:hypothetical protein